MHENYFDIPDLQMPTMSTFMEELSFLLPKLIGVRAEMISREAGLEAFINNGRPSGVTLSEFNGVLVALDSSVRGLVPYMTNPNYSNGLTAERQMFKVQAMMTRGANAMKEYMVMHDTCIYLSGRTD